MFFIYNCVGTLFKKNTEKEKKLKMSISQGDISNIKIHQIPLELTLQRGGILKLSDEQS